MNGGWTAFTRQTGPSRNLWVRSPAGVETQVTFFGDASVAIEALNDDGRLVFRRAGRTYFWQPGHSVRDIALSVFIPSTSGTTPDQPRTRALFRDGDLYIIIGASVFRMGAGPFTDESLVAGVTTIRALHILELRQRVAAARQRVNLLPFTYTDPGLSSGTQVRAVHFMDLRSALAQAYAAAGLNAPTYTDPALTPGAPIKLVHLLELRNATKAIE